MRSRLLVCLLFLSACGGGSPSSPTGSGSTGGSTSPANIAGNYQFILTASPSCAGALSRDVRQLAYSATITQSGSTALVNLTGGQFSSIAIQGQVSGTTYSPLVSFGDIGRGLIGVVATCQGTLTLTSGNLQGSCSGPISEIGAGACNAADHSLVLNRR